VIDNMKRRVIQNWRKNIKNTKIQN